MQNVKGSLKTNELKLQGTEGGVDFKLKVENDELHIKQGNKCIFTDTVQSHF